MASEERSWYLDATLRFGWTKAQLLEKIKAGAWREETLDELADICYTEAKEIKMENQTYEKGPLRVSWKYLPQPHGRIRDEGLSEESGAGVRVPYRVGGYQPGGDLQPGLSSGAAQAGGAWDLLRRPRSAAAHQLGLRQVRSADWHGQRKPAEYAPHLRWRPGWQAPPLDGLHRPPRRCCRPMVHRRFRDNLPGCTGGLLNELTARRCNKNG